jgi:hypothetical protein
MSFAQNPRPENAELRDAGSDTRFQTGENFLRPLVLFMLCLLYGISARGTPLKFSIM